MTNVFKRGNEEGNRKREKSNDIDLCVGGENNS